MIITTWLLRVQAKGILNDPLGYTQYVRLETITDILRDASRRMQVGPLSGLSRARRVAEFLGGHDRGRMLERGPRRR